MITIKCRGDLAKLNGRSDILRKAATEAVDRWENSDDFDDGWMPDDHGFIVIPENAEDFNGTCDGMTLHYGDAGGCLWEYAWLSGDGQAFHATTGTNAQLEMIVALDAGWLTAELQAVLESAVQDGEQIMP